MKSFTTIVALSVLMFCSNGSAAQCPLGSVEKDLLVESAIRNRQEAAWILAQSSQGPFPSRGFSRHLIASTSAHTGVFTLIEQCTAARTFERYCEPCEAEQACPTLRRCSQLACEQAQVDTVKLWWEPAPFIYKTDQPYLPGYTVRYAKRPTTFLRFDGRNANVLHVGWIANDTVVVRKNRGTVAASSFLIGRGERTEEGPQLADVHVYYVDLIDGQAIVDLSLQIDRHGVLTGSISANSRILANISEAAGDEPVKVAWAGACQ